MTYDRRAAASRKASRTSAARRAILSAVLAVTTPLASSAIAQTPAPRAPAPAARPAAAAPAAPGRPAAAPGVGLDALSDQIVMGELASREQMGLLNYMFESRKVPQADRETIMATVAIATLANASGGVSERRRQMLVKQSVDGLERALPTLTDPNLLMTYAGALIERGIEPDVNLLEYWGENPVTQARVKPAALVAQKMLEKVADAAKKRADDLTKAMNTGATDRQANEWEKMDALQNTATYVSNLIAYYVALGMDGSSKAGLDERAKVADAAIKYLSEFDQPSEDPNGIQPLVHNRIGKLNMAKGDYAAAEKFFNEVITGKIDEKVAMAPAPNAGQVYEARYFSALTDVLAKKPDVAEKKLNDLVAWQKDTKNVPAEGQKGVSAASEMLRFRMISAKADLSKDPAGKAKLEEQAAAVLNKLGEDAPEFKTIITEQLVNRLPENADLTKQNGLVLQALISKGYGERAKPDNVPVDKKILERAARSAELLGNPKSGITGVTPGNIQDAGLAAALFYDKLELPVQAANAYLAYAATYNKTPDEAKTAAQCVERAFGLAYKARAANANEPAVKELYAKAITTMARPPYSRKEIAFLYAEFLRTNEQNIPDAITFYRLVPKNDPSAFNARYWELQLINRQLQDPKTPADRQPALFAAASKLIDEVRDAAKAAPQTKLTKFRIVYTTVLGADLAIKQKQPQRALQLLEGFEATAADVENAAALINEAFRIRATAYMAGKQFDKATEAIIKLAESSPDAAKNLATSVLKSLGEDYDRYEAANRREDMAETSSNQSKLTDFMVTWTSSSKDSKIIALIPEYKLYDAKIKLRTGLLQTGDARKQALADALSRGQALMKDAKPASKDAAEATFATNVAYLVGLAQFEVADYDGASSTLGTLIRDGKLGGPVIDETDSVTGISSAKENTAYWEAMYKWLRSNVERSNKDLNNADLQKSRVGAQNTLKSMYITHGKKLGGEKFAKQFDGLRQDIIPEFNPDTIVIAPTSAPAATPAVPAVPAAETPASQPSAAPASQPVAGGA